MYRSRKLGMRALIEPEPCHALCEAIEAIDNAVAARQEYELRKMREQAKNPNAPKDDDEDE